MTLHTLNCTPGSRAFTDCLRLIAPGDAILLLGDGVYCALDSTGPSLELQACDAALYVLHDDAVAAGVLENLGNAQVIDIQGFVDLTEKFTRQLAWY